MHFFAVSFKRPGSNTILQMNRTRLTSSAVDELDIGSGVGWDSGSVHGSDIGSLYGSDSGSFYGSGFDR